MEGTGNEVVTIVQLVLNAGALVGGGVVWMLYVNKLKATVGQKDATIETAEKERDYWRTKAEELEKRSPEYMETMLAERISIREAEIARLADDRDSNGQALESARRDRDSLERSLESTKGFREMLELDGHSLENDPTYHGAAVRAVKLGEVGVDSGKLMITDPCYVDSQWQEEPFSDVRIVDDPATGESYVFRKDFRHFGETLPGRDRSINELLEAGVLIHRDTRRPGPHAYSYDGACAATERLGYGELVYRLGHAGAGVVFDTAFGDGTYPIYGEMRDGRIVRVYVNVG